MVFVVELSMTYVIEESHVGGLGVYLDQAVGKAPGLSLVA